ncbi:PTS sugar transporter subunit IIC [Lactobacillus sp. ESL0791]|uniref:PTS mannose/fructose/sorbose/N-acetylgalactosamine transporter subunit IIC n=1 Tax=Lactobacillus sp. ESL0791 TaxID=2983234 RepID=UPI0023F76F47|nr:PTS sugar transporter subunit IIC [Lactobacillus sp. ESL0791]MDF7639755.1 PTS sugar transporter subunit IIC [Lactobacillus sp. ESL0791]
MAIHMTILQAVLIGLFYWFRGCRFGYTFGVTTIYSPLPAALWVGIVLGDIPTAMKVGAALQLIYLGMLVPGGAAPADPTIAALVSCSIAVVAKTNINAAVALAVPIGLLGTQINNIEYIINGFLANWTDKSVDKGDTRGVYLTAVVYPTLFKLVLYAVPMAIILYFGATQIGHLINLIPQAVLNGLNLSGAVLPAVGFAVIVQQIGKKKLLPYFLAAFFLVQYTQIPTLEIALIGLFLAYLHITFTSKTKEE